MTSSQFPFHQAALVGQYDIFEELVKAGFNINELDENGLSPLPWAATGKSLEAVKELVRLGASPNTKASDQLLPMHHAAQNQNVAIMELLFELGTDVWMDGGIVMDELEELAKQCDNIEMTQFCKLRRAEKATGRKMTAPSLASLNDPLREKEQAAMLRVMAKQGGAGSAPTPSPSAVVAPSALPPFPSGQRYPVLIRTNLAMLKQQPLLQWTQADVLAFFDELHLSMSYAQVVSSKQLTGKKLAEIHTVEDWRAVGVLKYGDIRKLLKGTSQPPFDGSKKEYLIT